MTREGHVRFCEGLGLKCPGLLGTKLFALLYPDETIEVHLKILRSVRGPAAPVNTRCSPR
jgi:hypothetical protein